MQRPIRNYRKLSEEVTRPRRRPECNNPRPAARRHLGRRTSIRSIHELREPADLLEPLSSSLRHKPKDHDLYSIWGRLADALIDAQLHLLSLRLAKSEADGSIVSDLRDGRYLVVWPFNHMIMEEARQIHARGWLARRGVIPKLENLRTELLRAVRSTETRGPPVPNDFFGSLWSRIQIRNRPELLRRMQRAVLEYERIRFSLRSNTRDADLRHAGQRVRREIFQIMSAQRQDPAFRFSNDDDGSATLDLEDGREVNLKRVLRK